MLDTDICSYILKDRPASVRKSLAAVPVDSVCISVITYAELAHGLRRSSSKHLNRAVLDDFLRHLTVLDWTVGAADRYAELRVHLDGLGTPIGGFDLLIASHALSVDATLVTNNLRHFERVPKLRIENWV